MAVDTREAATPNTAAALQLIWKEGLISRADMARRLDLSRSTVSAIVSELLTTKLIEEVGAGPSKGGRRPILLEFQYGAFSILGVDIGATHVAVALTNLKGEVEGWAQRAHKVRDDPKGTSALVVELAEDCLAQLPKGSRRLVGVGVAVPSPVDPKHPDVLSEVVLPKWKGVRLTAELKAHFKVPVLLDNDANLGALAEHWWGAGRGIDDFVYVKVATGIGSGHIVAGKIYRGATGTAGEIGHMAIDQNGPQCICGLRGCLGTFIGTEALLRRTRELLDQGQKSQVVKASLTLGSVEAAALAGDPLATQVVREAASRLGIAVASMLNLMNPAVVAIGGSLSKLGDLLLEPLRETVKRRTLASSVAAASVVRSELGERDVAVGAATLVLDAALADHRLFPAPPRGARK